MKKRIATILLLICLVMTSIPTAYAGEDDWYTYTYNFWGDAVASPDAYSVERVLYGRSFGDEVGVFLSPESLFVIDDIMFVVDTKNNRIVELQWTEGEFELIRIINKVHVSVDKKDELLIGDEVVVTMLQPGDVFVRAIDKETREKVYGKYLGPEYIPPKKETTEPATTDEDASEGDTEDADSSAGTSDSEDADDASDDGDGATDGEGDAGDGATDGDDGEDTPAPVQVKDVENVIKKDLNRDYDIFIADTKNHRIIHCDYQLNVIDVLDNPKDETLAENYEFLPSKFVVDEAFRYYVQATNINAGLMEFTKDGTFTGYIGASPVTVSFIQRIWRKIQTKAQRARTKQYVPTEYNNVSMDSNGFLYVTTGSLTDAEIAVGNGKPVRKLNSMGTDILIRNGNFYPIGDIHPGNSKSISGTSAFVDVVTFENETYACLDKTRGKIFVYDFQGNLLYAFGKPGMNEGCFQNPSALVKLNEETIAVLDRFCGTITIFVMSDYGKLVNEALSLYRVGLYDESADIWREVLKYNGNCELAYVGIGRSLLRQGEYKKAMDNFEIVRDSRNYSKAYKYYREQVVEENIVWFIVVLAALIIVPKLIRKVIRVRKEIREA